MGLGLEDIGRFSQKAQAQILQKVQEQQRAEKASAEAKAKAEKPKKGNKLHAEKVDMTCRTVRSCTLTASGRRGGTWICG